MVMLSLTTIVAVLAATATARTCGMKIAPCPKDQTCVPLNSNCTNLNRCLGTCTTITKPVSTLDYQMCGGRVVNPTPCPAGHQCMDDPREKTCGMACDVPGICVPKTAPFCAVSGGRSCEKAKTPGMKCYDYPGDQCDPDKGDTSCRGICLFPLQ